VQANKGMQRTRTQQYFYHQRPWRAADAGRSAACCGGKKMARGKMLHAGGS